MTIDRRRLLSAAGMGGLALAWPGLALAAAQTDRRLVFVIQRGAADGMGILAPTGDPDFERVRGALAQGYDGGTKLGSDFTLHPAMVRAGALYSAGQFLPIHAVATAYRERSHFDAQNLLEGGGVRPFERADGWLNRLVGLLPGDGGKGLAIAPTLPLALRGKSEATSYAPSRLPDPDADLLQRVSSLYESDSRLYALWAEALRTRTVAAGLGEAEQGGGRALARLAAQFLSADAGARVAMIETNGWDTHNAQPARLAAQLRGLDAMLGELHDGLGSRWADTLVIVATEFGRTARVNGTVGTDHGTASLAMLAGGTVKGGRVVADWPGLSTAALFEDRDLKPTTDLESVIANAVSAHFGFDPAQAGRVLFPGRALRSFGQTLVT
ncbi:DUF1501 domain-containing protein [Tsuneonella sp. HG094]